MSQRVVCLHTVLSVAAQFGELTREILPDSVQVWHTVDEILAKVAVAQGELSPFIYRRVAEHVRAAEEAGADVVQFTCSSISPCAEVAQALVKIPVLKVDDPMVDRALGMGQRVGVAATAATALAPVAALVRDRARALNQSVTVDAVLCEGAYAGLISGDLAAHDHIVAAILEEMIRRNDVILLAQASMARVAEGIRPMPAVPILTSPRLAVERLGQVLRVSAGAASRA
jgi:Asp/Glu/hydantoin racemase